MSTIPTESQIFAERHCREARRLETLHAGNISPGAKTWRNAVSDLYARLGKIRSPIKQAAMVGKATAYLTNVRPEDCAHLMIAKSHASRSALLCFATFNAGRHPLVGVEEEGINIMQHLIECDRNGHSRLIYDVDLAYVSKHAIGRMHERECDLSRDRCLLCRNTALHLPSLPPPPRRGLPLDARRLHPPPTPVDWPPCARSLRGAAHHRNRPTNFG